MKSIGTNEKAQASLQKAQEQTKKHWFYYEKHMNQRKSIGLTLKNIRNNKKNGFTAKNIGTNEKALASL